MTTSQMHELARVGAEARLKAIAEEQQAIFTVFPELQDGAAPATRASSPAPSARKRSGMSPAQRKAVGDRMRAYWAKRRAEKAGAKKAATKTKRRGGMSAEARKAQAERMRAYWAQRRTQKQAGGDGAPAEAAETAAEMSAAPRTERRARRKATRKAGRRQARKK